MAKEKLGTMLFGCGSLHEDGNNNGAIGRRYPPGLGLALLLDADNRSFAHDN